MALNTEFAISPALADPANAWQVPPLDFPYHNQGDNQESPVFSNHDLFFQQPAGTTALPSLVPQRPTPEFVQPHDLHLRDADGSTSPSSQTSSNLGRKDSIDSTTTSSSLSLNHQQLLRRMSLASLELNDDSYRPRNTPARRKKSTTGRIAPRSEKHARELELNRRAATKCRNRQKAFIEHLQQRCRKEEEKMQMQTSLVSALHDEVVALRNEVLRQSLCDCRFLSGASTALFP
ncbi:uncharacterized protein Z520_01575 [Fonsecaea multimorphosa CBS 102226]|uniref:BZIP domain-containing protein n=1 Tax=Fonsecaea multimorphosa CBS 102226 TaxID=1442371 RepID=A0A0D2KAS0_9EURO|nr:uncharacterized protein Z520_01575 [Fonsecaea multimorphosa CBS 102226]KIY03108.1 hypothetical protein Z520_01575 [Fonsecaea multimorphosa CBS 102226]OAL30355.1 hypothetical protein AYO22_01553 [Fonsecaea multimorphosa]